jgi:hypothetical protein
MASSFVILRPEKGQNRERRKLNRGADGPLDTGLCAKKCSGIWAGSCGRNHSALPADSYHGAVCPITWSRPRCE